MSRRARTLLSLDSTFEYFICPTERRLRALRWVFSCCAVLNSFSPLAFHVGDANLHPACQD